ncbi:MAG: hypothetical protein KIS66_18040 [Fimbriimonadaceae bacterium]|nr:hypothetical protein [Fimbriimonadaceae bacterium]
MPVTNYHTVNGRTIGETTDGVRTDYLTDALGSVTATVDQSQNVLNTYRYKPYGGLLAKTGSSPDPRFLWTGDTGSRTTGLAYSEQYNRARHYGSRQAGWTSVDGNWPSNHGYEYGGSSPLVFVDPYGLSITYRECSCEKCDGTVPRPVPPPNPIGPVVKSICEDIRKCSQDSRCRNRAIQCIRDCGWKDAAAMFNCYGKYCLDSGRGHDYVEIICGNDWACHVHDACAIARPGKPCRVYVCTRTESNPCDCMPSGNRWTDRCTFPKCAADKNNKISLDITILHEMAHCCGVGPDGGPWGNQELPNCIANCMEHNMPWRIR